jgi:hypothetical protein
VAVDAAELFAGLEHAGGAAAQRHLPVAPALDVARDRTRLCAASLRGDDGKRLMPPGRPDLSVVTILFVVPPLVSLALLVAFLSSGDNGRAALVAVLLVLSLPLLVHSYRRDFPRERGTVTAG